MSVPLSLLLNLTLLVTLAFLCAMAFTLERGASRTVLHTVLGAVSSLVLMAFPGHTLAGTSLDLRFVPAALIMLGFGPRAAAPVFALLAVASMVQDRTWASPAALAALLGLGACWLLWRSRRSLRYGSWEVLAFGLTVSLPVLLTGQRSLFGSALPLLLGNVLGFVAGHWVLSSRLRLIQLTWRLRDLAHTDPLTGLPNRRQYERDLRQLPVGGALLLLDLDHFKRVNDTYGHATGDAALVVVGAVLGAMQSDRAQPYRIGGEEFAVMVQPGPGSSAETLGRLLLGRVREARVAVQEAAGQPSRPDLHLTCSVGLAWLEGDHDHVDMFRRADEALHESKQQGRDRLTVALAGGSPAPAPTAPVPAGRIQLASGQGGSHALWNALLDTLLELNEDRDPGPQDYQRLLDAAVLAVPGAGAGSLNVLDRERFVVVAQSGFGEALIGHSMTVAGQRQWYGGLREDQVRGQPRLFTEADIRQADEANLMLRTAGHLRANICVPVVVDAQVLAYLNLDSLQRPDAFGPESLEMAGIFGRQLAALLTARKRRAERLALEHSLAGVQDMAGQLQQAETAQAALEVLVGELHAALWADSVQLYSVSALGLDTLAVAGSVPPAQISLRPGDGLCWSSVERLQFLNVPAARSDLPGYAESLTGPHTLLLLPLSSPASTTRPGGGEVWGLLAVVRPQSRPFLPRDEASCVRFAQMTERALQRLEREDWPVRSA